MDHTTFNTTLSSCGLSSIPAKISPDLRAVFIVRIAVNALTCPLIILLNILVMVAVKTKRQLRTKSNIALACLATTDLVVGLVLQPLHIASTCSLLKGEHNMFCTVTDLSKTVTFECLLASFHHLVLRSAERYVAIKHPFAYETQVTEVRIIIASGLVWAAAIILYSEKILFTTELFKTILIVSETLLVILHVCVVILVSFNTRIPLNIRLIAIYLFALLLVLNSSFNPLIYAIRIRYFRVAFIQLMSRKTITQAEEF